jgi:hypothetical protein
MSDTSEPYISWTKEHENILIDWADKATCYRWLHHRSHLKYSTSNTYYTIPVIVISTLTGTANFAHGSIPTEYQYVYAVTIGCFNIVAGIISTVHQFLNVAYLMEAYRVSSLAWDKFVRNVRVELAKHADERVGVSHMIKTCKEEYDRIVETSPIVEQSAIDAFVERFSNKPGYNSVAKPDICSGLTSTREFVHARPTSPSTDGDVFARLFDDFDNFALVDDDLETRMAVQPPT